MLKNYRVTLKNRSILSLPKCRVEVNDGIPSYAFIKNDGSLAGMVSFDSLESLIEVSDECVSNDAEIAKSSSDVFINSQLSKSDIKTLEKAFQSYQPNDGDLKDAY